MHIFMGSGLGAPSYGAQDLELKGSGLGARDCNVSFTRQYKYKRHGCIIYELRLGKTWLPDAIGNINLTRSLYAKIDEKCVIKSTYLEATIVKNIIRVIVVKCKDTNAIQIQLSGLPYNVTRIYGSGARGSEFWGSGLGAQGLGAQGLGAETL